MCKSNQPQCGDTSILRISVAPNEKDTDGKEKFEWSFTDLTPEEAFCNWQFEVDGYDHLGTARDSGLVKNMVQVELKSSSAS